MVAWLVRLDPVMMLLVEVPTSLADWESIKFETAVLTKTTVADRRPTRRSRTKLPSSPNTQADCSGLHEAAVSTPY